MIATPDQIKSILYDNPNKEIIQRGIDYNKRMKMHLYGTGMDKSDEMSLIDGFERETMRKLRVKYSRSNKDLFARLSRPIDKVFNARGGSIYYNLSEEQDKKARALATNIRGGQSVRKWVETQWVAHHKDDPYGIIFMEILPEPLATIASKSGQAVVYPTYKSITSIFDYHISGNGFEYIVFNVTKKEKKQAGLKEDDIVYRFVDDAFDYYVRKSQGEIEIIKELSFPNLFLSVPGVINSDLPDPENEGGVVCLFHEVIELAKDFLLKGSIKLTHDFLHGFPKYAEFASNCSTCNGTGYKEAKECPECKGTGKKVMSRVSDVKVLEWPGRDDQVVLPANVGAYISPDKVFHEIATADQQMLEDVMTVTQWGTHSRIKAQGPATDGAAGNKTATEVMDEIKPQADRLYSISEMAEKRHKFILDSIIKIQINQSYEGASVNYGRRYMIEGPDVIWQKYADARAKGVAISALDDLLIEYYEAKFINDPVKLAIQVKLMKVEPFVHFKISEVKLFGVSEEDYKEKLFFGEWLSEQSDVDVLSKSAEDLRNSLDEFVLEKDLQQPDVNPVSKQLKIA
jgi:hypothetical protein